MSNLIFEVLLRLAKALAAFLLAIVVFLVALLMGAAPSIELALLSWLAAAAFILLVETSPI